MYNYRLWIELSESQEEDDLGDLNNKIKQLKQVFYDESNYLRPCPRECFLHANFSYFIQCSGGGSKNPKGANYNTLLNVLNYLVEILPGSHGLVYWKDDEEYVYRRDFDARYRVIVIAEGKVTERGDGYFPLDILF